VTLSEAELERYSRQLLMEEWSGAAQERLKSARAMVVGAGALGSPVCTYLAAAGVGTLAVVDGDVVELSNLHRQPLYMTPDVGAPKAEVAAGKLALLNPEVIVEPFPAELDVANAEAFVPRCGGAGRDGGHRGLGAGARGDEAARRRGRAAARSHPPHRWA